MKKQRNSNIELLRIVAMFLIVLHHAIVHGGLDKTTIDFYTIPNLLSHGATIFSLQSLVVLGKMGVAIFVLITGYFMVYSQARFVKVIKIWLTIFIYSLGLFVFAIAIGAQNFSIAGLVKSILPVIFSNYWFMTSYVVMYLFIPAINIFLNNATSGMRRLVIELLFLTNVILPILFATMPDNAVALGATNITSFIMLYLIGAEMRFRQLLQPRYRLVSRVLFWGSLIGYIASVACLDGLGLITKKTFFIEHATVLAGSGSNGIFALGMAVGLFILVGTKPIKSRKSINLVAASTLSVYLIHDNPYIRPWLWHTVFGLGTVFKTVWWLSVVRLIVVTVIVYVVATLIDMARKGLFNRIENRFCSWAATRINVTNRWLEGKASLVIAKLTR
ncbi:acyltransferase [Lactiplantibacillus pentosus]|uniref:Acyltransferase n=1 Tax=Lactiplantibacillus pentosus TaxID=1589 RepID=A0ABD7IUN2_LACPE|nr:acyltransferase [Lactiplantibacillus pentosus]RMW51112.1 acyltransferase [Lactiplantibacillus pentosus]